MSPEPAPPPPKEPPKLSPLLASVRLKQTPTPNRLTPDVGLVPYDEFRDDDINDPAEQELRAVFENDKIDTKKDDERFDLTVSPAPARPKSNNRARSSIDFLNQQSQKSSPENKPPSRAHTPGTLSAMKLKMFGNYNLGERSDSRASPLPPAPAPEVVEKENESDLEMVSPLPTEDVPVPQQQKDVSIGRSKTPTSDKPLPKKVGGPGKLQFQMKQKAPPKRAVKTGALNLSKFSKFGKGGSKQEDDKPAPPPSKKPAECIPSRKSVELDGVVPPAEEFKMQRRRKSMEDEEDPFKGLPQSELQEKPKEGTNEPVTFQRKPVAELDDSKDEFQIKRRPRSIPIDDDADRDGAFDGVPQVEENPEVEEEEMEQETPQDGSSGEEVSPGDTLSMDEVCFMRKYTQR